MHIYRLLACIQKKEIKNEKKQKKNKKIKGLYTDEHLCMS